MAIGGFSDKQAVVSFVEANGGICTLEKKKNQVVTHIILGYGRGDLSGLRSSFA